jgi:hypothetical protein
MRSRPKSDNPFQFKIGDIAYVRGWEAHKQVSIVEAFLHRPEHGPSWPHYIVSTRSGRRWTISQLELSSRTITETGKLEGVRPLRFSPAVRAA